jgi:hypothetical protein
VAIPVPTPPEYTKAQVDPADHSARLPRRVELHRRAPHGRHADGNPDYFFASTQSRVMASMHTTMARILASSSSGMISTP